MEDLQDKDLLAAREMVASASSVVVFTGAGISAESGVPTFRGPEGLWKNFRPEQLATPSAFAADARLVWEWYDWRRRLVAECLPNAGHRAVAQAQVTWAAQLCVLTQNVDGLHGLALSEAGGTVTNRSVTQLHGSLFELGCSQCDYGRSDRTHIDTTAFDRLPRCPECGALLRPGVVWFGEALDHDTLDFSFRAAAAADVCVVVGTSAVVEPAASLPRQTAAAGGSVIEVNIEPTPLSRMANVSLMGTAAKVLPLLFET